MTKIEQEGTYRGQLIDWGVSKSKSGYPQFVAECFANEMWDEDENQWVDVSDCQVSTVAYLVLVDGKQQPTFHHKSLMESLNWDGKSYAQLSGMDLSSVVLQFRVEENTYNDKTSLQVQSFDSKDAIPGVKIRKLDTKKLGELDSEFSDLLKAASGNKPTVASANPAQKGTPPTKPTATAKSTGKGKGRGRPKKNVTPAAPPPSPAAPPTPPPTPPPAPEEEIPTPGPCDMGTAWDNYTSAASKLNEGRMNEIWLEVVEEVAQGAEESDITDEQWGIIRAKLFAHEEVCPF